MRCHTGDTAPNPRGAIRRSGTAAVLVVHGIGQQDRYSTLDGFARGLIDASRRANNRGGVPEHRLVERVSTTGSTVESAIHLELKRGLPHCGSKALDLFEFYWAPLTQRKIKLPRVLAWLARTSLTPLRFWATDPTLPKGTVRQSLYLGREVLRSLLFPIVVAVLALPFAFTAGYTNDLKNLGSTAADALPGGVGPIVGVVGPGLLALGALVLLFVGVKTVWRLLKLNDAEQASTFKWACAALSAGSVLAVATIAIELFADQHLADYVDTVRPDLLTGSVAWIVGASAAALALRGALVSTLGDIPLYVTADEKSDLYQTRAEILDGCEAFLRWLLREYGAVYVAGHSLGSVIAYDTLNQLQREDRITGAERLHDFSRLQGLFTFGSPLDKIDYFFRTRIKPDQKIRAQLLASLHGFQHAKTGRDFDPYTLQRYTIRRPPGFWWLNCWAHADLVSARLTRYLPDEQCNMGYWSLRAHSQYWRDGAFFDKVYSRL